MISQPLSSCAVVISISSCTPARCATGLTYTVRFLSATTTGVSESSVLRAVNGRSGRRMASHKREEGKPITDLVMASHWPGAWVKFPWSLQFSGQGRHRPEPLSSDPAVPEPVAGVVVFADNLFV